MEFKRNLTYAFLAITAFISINGCTKTSYVSGESPLFDTTGAIAVGVIEAPIPDEGDMEISNTFSLDGSTSYMVVENNAELNIGSGKNMSITFWMKTESATGGYYIVSKRPTVAPSPGYEIIMNTARIQANVRNTANKDHQTPYGTGVLADNKWHHIAFVFNQNGVTLSTMIYLDGVLNTVSVTAPNYAPPVEISNDLDLVVGAKTNFANKFKGDLDDLRIWNKAMTVEEVLEDMDAKVDSNTPDLVASWDFENIDGSTVKDIKGNHSGVINGVIILGERQVKK